MTPSGRLPGTSRAERGRSRQPVASTTAAGASVARPVGGQLERPACAQPVTIVSRAARRPPFARARRSEGVGGTVQRTAQVAQAEPMCWRGVGCLPPRPPARSRRPRHAAPASSIAAASPAARRPRPRGRSVQPRLSRSGSAASRAHAVEALAASQVSARASAQAVEVRRRDRAGERVAKLAARNALAEADDASVLGVGGDQVRALVGPRRMPRRCSACAAAGESGRRRRRPARARRGRARRSPSRPRGRWSGFRRRRRSRRSKRIWKSECSVAARSPA